MAEAPDNSTHIDLIETIESRDWRLCNDLAAAVFVERPLDTDESKIRRAYNGNAVVHTSHRVCPIFIHSLGVAVIAVAPAVGGHKAAFTQ